MAAVVTALGQGATVVAGSRRSARRIAGAYADHQLQQCDAWPSPELAPWSGWLRRCWQTVSEKRLLAGQIDEPVLLDASQSRLLWRQIIEADPAAAGHLLNLPATAARVAEAWELIQQWRIRGSTLATYPTPELELLLRWSERFLATCRERNWLDPARLPEALAARAADLAPKPASAAARQILLVGFDELTPQQRLLLEALAQQGWVCTWLEIGATPAAATRVSLGDSHEEFVSAARWARQLLETGGTRPPRIGLVVADLETEKATLETVLTGVFCPGQGPEQLARWVNFSYGRRLREWPPVAAALTLLELLVHRRLPAAAAGELLRSPFLLASEDESGQRVEADLLLRRPGATQPSLADVLQACLRADSQSLAGALSAARDERWSGRQSPRHWAQRFAAALAACGWPGQRSLDSAEFQCVKAWHELFDQLSDLGLVAEQLSATEALARLNELAADSLFQPQSSGTAPIQVLGLLEATGESLDQLWLTGMTDLNWPAPPRPNPFLPQKLQSELGLPHASAARELRFAADLLQRLRAGADGVVFSHARRRGDEDLRVSPLILDLPESSADRLALYSGAEYPVLIQASGQLEAIADEHATRVPSAGLSRGGAALFQDQIACPYRAFAHHRLQASAPETVSDGLDARVRGLLLHDVMDKVWQQLGGSAALDQRESAPWQARLAALVEDCIAAAAKRYPGLLDGRIAAIEQARLCACVDRWLALEAGRPAFEVAALEQRRELRVGPLSLRVRLDRVDHLDARNSFIIDYKTGRCATADLLDARPREPQLPLYAAFIEPAPAAIALASLRVGESGFNGIGADAIGIDGVTALDPDKHGFDWPGLLARWREELAAVAAAFAAGEAAVAPRDSRSCQYCDLPILCRIGLDQDSARSAGGNGDV